MATIEDILNYVRKHNIIEYYSITDIAETFNVSSQMINDLIDRIEQTHRFKKIGKKIHSKSQKYLDFEAFNPKDSSNRNVYIKLIK